ncbi:MAG: 2-oxoglutarate and iron-dependent oxygenase domain-containing protein [Gemmatimonadales bacterium]
MSKKEHGVDAVSTEYERYDQVRRPQEYRLAESTTDDRFDEDFVVRTCDMRAFYEGGDAGKAEFAEQLGRAMQEIGFAILVNHGVDPTLHEEARDRVIEVFTKPSLEQKLRYTAARVGSVKQGYFPIKETSDIHPDLVEGWVFCRRAFDLGEKDGEPYQASDFWPDPAAEPFFRRIALAHEALIIPITQSIFRYLGVDPHHYDEKLTRTNFGLRLNYYPPIGDADDASGAGRLLGHEDVDLFTILPAPDVEGLQALHRASGKWVRVQAPPGSIILNTGDYMQRITNDILPSTTHRVSKPRDPSARGRTRVSFPMAVYVWEDELLEVLPGLQNPKYEPIKAITFHTRTTSKFYGDGYAVEQTNRPTGA